MEKKIRLLIVDDHKIVRQGLCEILENYPEIEVIGEAENGREAIQKVKNLHPNVVLMDISMPSLDGISSTRQIKKEFPEIKVLILTMYDNEEYIRDALLAQASGFIMKDISSEEFITAIRAVHSGYAYLSPKICKKLIEIYLNIIEKEEKELEPLSDREKEVLKLLAEGYSNKRIADILCIGTKTVETHRTNIRKKLHLKHLSDLVKYAIQKGLVNVPKLET